MINRSSTAQGTLFVVATPIGNREDISARALKTLKEVDVILAEDTRHSGQLLTLLGIKKPLISFHAHNEAEKSQTILARLNAGQSIALISDAGTPLISDPGYPLIQAAQENGFRVSPIPGPCALITALSAAGIPCDTFTFIGFLPAKSQARQRQLQTLLNSEHTLVMYESTHRIKEALQDIGMVFGEECTLVAAKELTKTFECFIRGSSNKIIEWLDSDPTHLKGEFVIMIPPRSPVQKAPNEIESILKILLAELPLKQAVKIGAQLTKENKNEVYKLALQLNK